MPLFAIVTSVDRPSTTRLACLAVPVVAAQHTVYVCCSAMTGNLRQANPLLLFLSQQCHCCDGKYSFSGTFAKPTLMAVFVVGSQLPVDRIVWTDHRCFTTGSPARVASAMCEPAP